MSKERSSGWPGGSLVMGATVAVIGVAVGTVQVAADSGAPQSAPLDTRTRRA